MAVAVKNPPESATATLLDRPAVVSLVGVAYVIGSLGVVFKVLPYLWYDALRLDRDSYTAQIVLAMLMVGVATGLFVLGARLLGPRAARGVRAGIFVGVVGVLLILLLTRWASIWLEFFAFQHHLLGPTVGVALTALVGVALLVAGGYFFLQRSFEPYLVRFEEQGWFSATTYKGLQGVRVRRGTILGILLLAGAGIFTLLNHGTLRRGPADWALNVPFTSRITVDAAALNPDTREKFAEYFKTDANRVVESRYALRDFNEWLSSYVKIDDPGSTDLSFGQVVERTNFTKEVARMKEEKLGEPSAVPLQPVWGPESFATVTLLPSVQFTLPIFLMGLAIWVAWRIVNYPAFADFLIATEAELNKVSWTTRRRLVQDTIVVLVTVFLMTVYLFAMDQAWAAILSLKPIGVLQIPKEQPESSKSVEKKPW